MRLTATLAALTAAGFLCGNARSPAPPSPQKKAQLKVRSYLDPGLQYFRAAESDLKKSGVPVSINVIGGDWFDSRPAYLRKDVLKSITKGTAVSTGVGRLTPAEKERGLDDTVLGYYAAVLYVHPDAPIDSIDSRKWAAIQKPGKKFTWKDIASDAQHTADLAKVEGKNPIDNEVTWTFPDAAYAAFAKPFIRLGAISPDLLKLFPRKDKELTPIAATHIVSDYEDRIGIFGYNLVLENQIHPLKPVRLLKVNGVYPTEETIANGSYPFATPVTVVYSAKAAKSEGHPVQALLRFLKSEPSAVAAREGSLVRRL